MYLVVKLPENSSDTRNLFYHSPKVSGQRTAIDSGNWWPWLFGSSGGVRWNTKLAPIRPLAHFDFQQATFDFYVSQSKASASK